MSNSKVVKGILLIFGFLLTIMGSWRLFSPISFFKGSGLILVNEAGLLSEARVTGGIIAAFGIIILLGAFYKKITFTSLIIATVIFFGAATARIISYIADGDPGAGVLKGLISEIIAGFIVLIAIYLHNKK